MDALELLDYDCWAEVFKKLENDDFPSLSNVCKIFRKLMDDYRYGFCEGKWKFDLILPRLMPYLGNHDQAGVAVKSRGVCKSWMKSIDSILEEREICPKLSFGTLERIDDFLERFGRSNPSPILLRRLCLNGERDDDEELYYARLLEATQQFGMNVWELQIRSQPPDFLPILHHLPHLKDLRFLLPLLADENEELFHLWHEYALPDLPQLRRFEIYGGVDAAGSLSLKRYGPQIEDLIFWGLDTFLTANLEINRSFIQHFRALKSLRFTTPMQNAQSIFAILQFLDCPLELFKIVMVSEIEEEPWQIDSFLKSISHLQLLRDVTIELRNIYLVKSAQLQLEDYSNTAITHLNLALWCQTNHKMTTYFLPALIQLSNLNLLFYYNEEIQLGLQTDVDLKDGFYVTDLFDNHQIRHHHLYEAHSNNIWDSTSLEKLNLAVGHGSLMYSLDFSREECEEYRNRRAQSN